MMKLTVLALLSSVALIAPHHSYAAAEDQSAATLAPAAVEAVPETASAAAPVQDDTAQDQDARAAATQADAPKKDVVPSQQAVKDSTQLHEAIDALIKDTSEANQKHFMALYHTHNILSVVKTVRHDVGNAVKACAEKNEDLAEKLTTRFEDWKDAVAPVLIEAEGNINNMIIAQDYAAPQDITGALNLANKVRAKGEASVNKVPVSNKEACEKLYKTMKETQDKVVTLMKETLVSVPHALQAEQAELQKQQAQEQNAVSSDNEENANQ